MNPSNEYTGVTSVLVESVPVLALAWLFSESSQSLETGTQSILTLIST